MFLQWLIFRMCFFGNIIIVYTTVFSVCTAVKSWSNPVIGGSCCQTSSVNHQAEVTCSLTALFFYGKTCEHDVLLEGLDV